MTHTTTDHSTDQLDAGPVVALTGHSVAALAEILAMVEEFLRTAGPNVHAELHCYLTRQNPPADPGWLIDMLGFHTLHLHHQLQGQPASPASEHDAQVAW